MAGFDTLPRVRSIGLAGIAMAQLGELAKARVLLRRAARSFGQTERVGRAFDVTLRERHKSGIARTTGGSGKNTKSRLSR